MSRIDDRLARLGVMLPTAPAPVAKYVPWIIHGPLLFISGQLSTGPDGDLRGVVGNDLDLDRGRAAARLCGLNLISQMHAACGGDLDKVTSILKVTGFINAARGFEKLPLVLDGCSELLVEVFGDAGRHARSVLGAGELPRGCTVEIDAIVALRVNP